MSGFRFLFALPGSGIQGCPGSGFWFPGSCFQFLVSGIHVLASIFNFPVSRFQVLLVLVSRFQIPVRVFEGSWCLGCWFPGSGYRVTVSGSGLWVTVSRCQVLGVFGVTGFRFPRSGFLLPISGFQVQRSTFHFRAPGSDFKVSVSGFWVPASKFQICTF